MREQWQCDECEHVYVVFAKNAVDLFEQGCNRCSAVSFTLIDEVPTKCA